MSDAVFLLKESSLVSQALIMVYMQAAYATSFCSTCISYWQSNAIYAKYSSS